jgi:hypothetical protein
MVAWYTYPIVGDFGQQLQGFTYPVQGEDIETPFNTPITTPFAGTITAAYYDQGGGQVIEKVDDPSQTRNIPYFWVAHLDQIFASLGTHINAGTTLGLSGGQNTGGQHPAIKSESSGSHTEYGEAKQNFIPYTLAQITPDLNPDWIPAYAQQHAISAGSSVAPVLPPKTGNAPTQTNSATGPCTPPDTLATVDGVQYCKHDNGNGTFSYTSVQQGGSGPGTDPLASINSFLASISPWVSDPTRILKAIAGLMLIGLAIILIAAPQGTVASSVIKGARKVGIR